MEIFLLALIALEVLLLTELGKKILEWIYIIACWGVGIALGLFIIGFLRNVWNENSESIIFYLKEILFFGVFFLVIALLQNSLKKAGGWTNWFVGIIKSLWKFFVDHKRKFFIVIFTPILFFGLIGLLIYWGLSSGL